MRKIWLVLWILIVLALDWAALHDILKGEPDVWMEWGIVITSAVMLAVFVILKLNQARKD